MQTASFNGIIKVIFYIIIFFYVFKLLARLFLPVIVKKVVQKAGENFQQQQEFNNQNSKSYQKEDVIIDTAKVTKPRESKKVGEYVDYEEID